jgi:hypothetical protein
MQADDIEDITRPLPSAERPRSPPGTPSSRHLLEWPFLLVRKRSLLKRVGGRYRIRTYDFHRVNLD